MTPATKLALTSVLALFAIGTVLGASYLSSSSTIANQQQTISGLESSVSSLLSHPVTLTATRTTTLMTTPTIATTTSVVQTITQFISVPFDNPIFMYLSPDPGGGTCSTGFCWGAGPPTYAIHFDCGGSVPASCPVNFYNKSVNLNFSVVASWQGGQPNQPTWSNCSWKTYWISPYMPNSPPSLSSEGYGYCVSTGPTAFIIAMPPPPPL